MSKESSNAQRAQGSDTIEVGGVIARRNNALHSYESHVCAVLGIDGDGARLYADECTRLGTFLLAAANRSKGGGTCSHCAGQGTITEFDERGNRVADCAWCNGRGGS